MATHNRNTLTLVAVAVAASIVTVASVAYVTAVAINDTAYVDAGANNVDDPKSPTISALPYTASDDIYILDSQGRDADVVMPTKVSRPGCEDAKMCYVPSEYHASVGSPITWTNTDSAFHTVTSGTYDDPLSMFDSGYMDPYDSYTLSFDLPGTYSYYCTLHPWMQGLVVITP